ncbi:hypothetical protein [Streptomyces anthocyanicus]|uniref:hypothetical protein n=1 Tax=Streptomyces anthocyanicus TaxID=68174 RepID=UPI002F910806|nr:hypothetical protein OH747_39600 [Streptomyces anthocyanicus]
MPKYEVLFTRTGRISVEVDAVSAQDAEERYLSDGDKTGSKTICTEVESVTRVDTDAPTPGTGE